MKEKQKPLIIEIEDVRQELAQSINNAMKERKIPCYFLDMILTDICGQIKALADKELIMAKEYEQQNDEQGEE